jgi:hypothetical protein
MYFFLFIHLSIFIYLFYLFNDCDSSANYIASNLFIYFHLFIYVFIYFYLIVYLFILFVYLCISFYLFIYLFLFDLFYLFI